METLAALLVAMATNGPDPRLGTWEELRGQSADFQSLRRTFESLDNGLERMVVNAKLDAANRWHVDFRCDGRAYPMVRHDGTPVGQTVACRIKGEREFDITLVRNGESGPSATTTVHETVSGDGQRYVVVARMEGPDGQPRVVRREFVRAGPSPG